MKSLVKCVLEYVVFFYFFKRDECVQKSIFCKLMEKCPDRLFSLVYS